jgi:hypothetical protein
VNSDESEEKQPTKEDKKREISHDKLINSVHKHISDSNDDQQSENSEMCLEKVN